MKTGHRAIQLHTYGPQPSTCVNLYVCMPSGSVLSVPGVRLPSGCICVCLCPPTVWARAKCVHCRERVAGRGGMLRIMLGNPPIGTLAANWVPTNSLSCTRATSNYGNCGQWCLIPTTNTHLKREMIQIPQRVWISFKGNLLQRNSLFHLDLFRKDWLSLHALFPPML